MNTSCFFVFEVIIYILHFTKLQISDPVLTSTACVPTSTTCIEILCILCIEIICIFVAREKFLLYKAW